MTNARTDESVESLLAQHEGELVAFTVTERDEYGQPTKGELVAHSTSATEVYEAVKTAGLREICFRYAGQWPPEGQGFAF